MVQFQFADEQLQEDLKQLTNVLLGVTYGQDFDVKVIREVVERLGAEFYQELENEFRDGMHSLTNFKNIMNQKFGYFTYDSQINRKTRFAMEDKMFLSMLKGNVISDLYRGRSIIMDPRIPNANYRGLEGILKGHPSLIKKLPDIDFAKIKENIGPRRFKEFEEEYKKSIEQHHINMIYKILPEFERLVEDNGGEIINISAIPFKYEGGHTLTSMVQNFDRFLESERSLKAIISKFDDKDMSKELSRDLTHEMTVMEGKSIPDSDISLTFMDETGTFWLIVNKDDLQITIQGDNLSYFVKDSTEIAKAYLKRNRKLKIKPDEMRRKVLNHALTLEFVPPLWYIERSMERDKDIEYVLRNFSRVDNGTKRQLLVHDMGADQKRYEDTIAEPKPNDYQTIRYRIKIWGGFPIEWQFRTKYMHYIAEESEAEHERYKKERYEEAREKHIIPVKGLFSKGEARKEFLKGLEEILDSTIQRSASEKINRKRDEIMENDIELVRMSNDIKNVKEHLSLLVDKYIENVYIESGDWTPVREVIEALSVAYYENSGLDVIRRYEEARNLYAILGRANKELDENIRFNIVIEQPQEVQLRHYEALVELVAKPGSKKRALFSYGFMKLAEEYEERIAKLEKNERFDEIRKRLEAAKKENFVKVNGAYHHKLVDYGFIKKNAHNIQLCELSEPEVLEKTLSTDLNRPDIASLGYDNLKFVVDNACDMARKVCEIKKSK